MGPPAQRLRGAIHDPVDPARDPAPIALDLINGKVAPANYSAHFSPAFMAAVPASQIGATTGELTQSAPWAMASFVSGPTATDAVVNLVGKARTQARQTIRIDAGSQMITELLVQPSPSGGPATPSAALASKASAVASELVAGQFGAVRAEFDPTMAGAISVQRLSSSWADAAGSLGQFQKAADPITKAAVPGFATYFVPLTFARGSLEVQIAFDGDGQIAGLFLRPPGFDSNF